METLGWASRSGAGLGAGARTPGAGGRGADEPGQGGAEGGALKQPGKARPAAIGPGPRGWEVEDGRRAESQERAAGSLYPPWREERGPATQSPRRP